MANRAHSGTLPDSVADEGRGAAKPAWAPLLLGSVLIVALAMLASEWLLDRIGLGTDPVHSVVFMFRGALLSTLLAIWTGYYVLQMRRRVEGAHAEIAERRHELEVVAMRAEQAAGLGASARILANELRGPLNAVAIQTEILKRKTTEGTDEMIDESLRVLTEQTSRMKRLIDDYIAYARAADVVLSPATVRLESVMLRAVHASAALRESGVLASVAIAPGLPSVRADEAKIAEAFGQILRCACASIHDGGSIRVELARDGQWVRVDVCDDGSGFADPGAVFRPFFATGDVGVGFALPIARDIVRAHGGEIHASNAPTGGGCVTVRLPIAVPS